jgi:ribose/xylose/arabinose/galactoside ABC-type transport system permease subunit
VNARDFAGWILPIAAAVAMLAVALAQPLFLTTGNLLNVVGQSAPLAIVAIAQMLPILTRGLDLSQGGVVVATSVVFALVAQPYGATAGMAAGLAVGLGAGLVNGAVVGGARVSPFVVTLGLGSVLQGAALILANGQPISDVPDGFAFLFYGRPLGIPVPLIVVALVWASIWLLLQRGKLGRHIYAVGSSERAAYLSGIPTRRTLIYAYTLSGFLTSVGSLLLSSRIASGHPTAGSDIALQAVAAAVIGGVSLFGGRGSVHGALAGAVFLGLLANALNLLSVTSFLQLIAIGLSIIVAVIIDRVRFASRGGEG